MAWALNFWWIINLNGLDKAKEDKKLAVWLLCLWGSRFLAHTRRIKIEWNYPADKIWSKCPLQKYPKVLRKTNCPILSTITSFSTLSTSTRRVSKKYNVPSILSSCRHPTVRKWRFVVRRRHHIPHPVDKNKTSLLITSIQVTIRVFLYTTYNNRHLGISSQGH